MHRVSSTFRNYLKTQEIFKYFKVNPWREHLIFDKYGSPYVLDPKMPDKDLDFYVYSNKELL